MPWHARFCVAYAERLPEQDQQHRAQQQAVDDVGQHAGANQQADEEVDALVGADGGAGAAEQEHVPVDRRASSRSRVTSMPEAPVESGSA